MTSAATHSTPTGIEAEQSIGPVQEPLSQQLPPMSSLAAELRRWLFDRRQAPLCAPATPNSPMPAPWHIEPARPPEHLPLYRVELRCQGGGATLLLARDDPALQMVARTADNPHARGLALDLLCADALQALQCTGLQGWHAKDLTPAKPQQSECKDWMALRQPGRTDPPELFFALLQLTPSLRQRLRPHGRTAPPLPALRQALRLPAAVRIGQRRLRPPLLRSLARGDVLLLERLSEDSRPWPALLQLGAGRAPQARARLESRQLILESPLHMPTEDSPSSASAFPDTPAPVDAIELTLGFELENTAIALSELEAMGPGYVIELGSPVDQAQVRLVVNGILVGRAHLVSVGGRLGACITELGHAAAPDLPHA